MPNDDYEGKATPLGPGDPVEYPAVAGATFAERAAAHDTKQVDADDAEDKAVRSASTKKRTTRKKG